MPIEGRKQTSDRFLFYQRDEYLRQHLPALTKPTPFGRQEPQVKLTGAPFALVKRANIAEIIKCDEMALRSPLRVIRDRSIKRPCRQLSAVTPSDQKGAAR